MILTLFPPDLPNSPEREAWEGALPDKAVSGNVSEDDPPVPLETALDTVWETRG